jgi:hypothetical protein
MRTFAQMRQHVLDIEQALSQAGILTNSVFEKIDAMAPYGLQSDPIELLNAIDCFTTCISRCHEGIAQANSHISALAEVAGKEEANRQIAPTAAESGSQQKPHPLTFTDYHGATVNVETACLADYAWVKSEQLNTTLKPLVDHVCGGDTLDAKTLEAVTLHTAALAFDVQALMGLIAQEAVRSQIVQKGGVQ